MRLFIRKVLSAALASTMILTGSLFINTNASAAERKTARAAEDSKSAVAVSGSAIADTGSAISGTKADTGSAIVVHHKKIHVKDVRIKSVMPSRKSVLLSLSSKGKGSISGIIVYKKKKSTGKWVIKAVIRKKSGSLEDTRVSFNKSYSYRARAFYKDSKGRNHYGKYCPQVKVRVSIHKDIYKVTDKNSPVYGKTLILYRYGNGELVTDPEKHVKIKADSYVLYVNKAKDYVSAYAVAGKKLIPVKSFICSPGNATPLGIHKTLAKFRWHELMGPCWGQWCTRITNNGIYFHSIFSSKPNSNSTISVRAYNNLGTTCSHGCVRLTAASAKWIYDNCKVGTTVVIHSKTGYEPFKKPVIGKLPAWHTWDPTDPTAQKLCKKHKCHSYAAKKIKK